MPSSGPAGRQFATLVLRHGAAVWQTCYRVLGQEQDAGDPGARLMADAKAAVERLAKRPLAGR